MNGTNQNQSLGKSRYAIILLGWRYCTYDYIALTQQNNQILGFLKDQNENNNNFQISIVHTVGCIS